MSQDVKIAIGIFLLFALVIALGVMASKCEDTVDASGREPIPCPEGYTDCTGILVEPTPEPVPTVEPPPVVTLEPDCRHTHPEHFIARFRDTVFCHEGSDHHPDVGPAVYVVDEVPAPCPSGSSFAVYSNQDRIDPDRLGADAFRHNDEWGSCK